MKSASRSQQDILKIDRSAKPRGLNAPFETSSRPIAAEKGAVLTSGGIDSSVTARCAPCLGPARVIGLFMPETDGSSDSLDFGKLCVDRSVFEHLSRISPVS